MALVKSGDSTCDKSVIFALALPCKGDAKSEIEKLLEVQCRKDDQILSNSAEVLNRFEVLYMAD